MTIFEGYLSEAELAEQLGKCRRTLQIWRQRREGPAWTKVGSMSVVYRRDAIMKWLRAQEQQPAPTRRKSGAAR